MDLHNLEPASGEKKKKQRKGRGNGSGRGFTCGRGSKGQNARSGGGVGPIFEGGQTRLFVHLPKRGFNSKNKKEYNEVNVYQLNQFDNGEQVTPQSLLEKDIINFLAKDGIKILGKGEITKSLKVKAHAFSSSAKEKIENAEGKVEVI